MKKFYFLLMLLFTGVTNNLHAQENGVYDINVTAMSESSGIHAAIGEANLASVRSLKVTGSINSYDIMIIRNKMLNLNVLDLSDASIVYNAYKFRDRDNGEDIYQSNIYGEGTRDDSGNGNTDDNILPAYAFAGLTNLTTVKLPRTITRVGHDAFYDCTHLTSLTMYDGVIFIGMRAFYNCDLRTIVIPEGVSFVMNSAFASNKNLSSIAFPSSLQEIRNAAFMQTGVENLSFPVGLKIIGSGSFSDCLKLKELRIPSSVTNIESSAFVGTFINDIYLYTIEPLHLAGGAFSIGTVSGHDNYSKATLHVPAASYYKYYWDTNWSRFQNIVEHNEEYTYFFIDSDLELTDARIEGQPDADLNAGSGLTIEGATNQNMDDISLKSDDDKGGSLITDNNVVANNLRYDITVSGSKWYFFCFPSRIKIADIVYPGQYVFRYYDGATRAANGSGGWKDLPDGTTHLEPGIGYIFQGNASGVLSIKVETPDFSSADRQEDLTAHAAANNQDAGWNFIGNPHMSYFDINDTGFTSAFTVWNGNTYVAYRPGDDLYHFHPFQAFFVQKPDGKDNIVFDSDYRTTYIKAKNKDAIAGARGFTRSIDDKRHLINLEIFNDFGRDKTRIVFNDEASTDYETACDAAKFLSTEEVPQLYTLDNKMAQYAINERPNGEVALGYSTKNAGQLTITAERMDEPMILIDNEAGIQFDLSLGGYQFESEAGAFNDRFILISTAPKTSTGIEKAEANGVSVVGADNGIYIQGANSAEISIYSLTGVTLVSKAKEGLNVLPKGTYIVKINKQSMKVLVK